MPAPLHVVDSFPTDDPAGSRYAGCFITFLLAANQMSKAPVSWHIEGMPHVPAMNTAKSELSTPHFKEVLICCWIQPVYSAVLTSNEHDDESFHLFPERLGLGSSWFKLHQRREQVTH